MTVEFTIAGSATSTALDCILLTSSTGTGTSQLATMTFNGKTITRTACAELPNLTMTKTIFQPARLRGRQVDHRLRRRGDQHRRRGDDLQPHRHPDLRCGRDDLEGVLRRPRGHDRPVSLQLATNQPITPSEVDSYTVTVEFTIAGSATSTALDCILGEGEQGTGSLNSATASWQGGTITRTACAELPNLTMTKTISSPPAFAAGKWTIAYDVVVTNTGAAATTYSLTDTPTFGAGVTISKVSSGALEDTTDPFSLQLATNQPITPSEVDSYTVTVEFTIAGSATSTALDCILGEGEQGTGSLNSATASWQGGTITRTACAELPNLTMTKTISSPPAFAAGKWTIAYDVVVTNTGAAATTYSLTDTPTFGAGVTISKVSSGALEDTTDPFSLQLATNQPITPSEVDSYTVTVEFTIAGSATSTALDCILGEGEQGTGSLNSATASWQGGTITRTACAELPNLTMTKTISSPPAFAAGKWTIAYDVVVTNTGAAATTYSLTDTPTFGAGVTISKVSSGALEDTTDPFSLQLATNQPITPSEVDSYTVTVEFTIAGSATSTALDCILGEGEQGTGSLNSATASWQGGTIKDDACAPVPKLTITKDVAQAPTSNGTTWSVSYDVKVTNSGPVATTYNLSDTPTFGPNVTVTKSSSGALVSTTAPFSLQLADEQVHQPRNHRRLHGDRRVHRRRLGLLGRPRLLADRRLAGDRHPEHRHRHLQRQHDQGRRLRARAEADHHQGRGPGPDLQRHDLERQL